MSAYLEFRPPRITAAFRTTAAAARRTVTVVLTDSARDAISVVRAWRKHRVAGDLVSVRILKRTLKLAGAAVEVHAVVVSLRPPAPITPPVPPPFAKPPAGIVQ